MAIPIRTVAISHVSKLTGVPAASIRAWVKDIVGSAGERAGLKTLRLAFQRQGMTLPEGISARPTFVVIDDDPDMLHIMRETLRHAWPSAVVSTSTDGARGLHAVEAKKPDLIVTDWQLPSLDGVSLCRRIIAEPELQHVRVVAISGRERPDLPEAFFESGAAEFLRKPFEPSELLASVERLIGRPY